MSTGNQNPRTSGRGAVKVTRNAKRTPAEAGGLRLMRVRQGLSALSRLG